MLNIFRKTRENERNEENSRFNRGFSRLNGQKSTSSDADLRCEEAIMKDKEQFGRTRTSLMKYLRAEYGNDVADRALRRINKRRTEGYFRK
ncbi:MAG: hypothetical protein AUH84_02035 [Thaumarchaeota archaeon 13_1_40CM_4_38_7]|nr:MAG: hypothetical protein AUH84_02035 [Thaumarchaeota archaeon 13_1_40CM_4_38_7]OLC93049.1 MAG: hypothetical protein AUI92_03750 [Thaumarchaeota archaeon 13_1_40CM_3_38_6]OLD40630.1 MAG: hypothetical protein AUI60_04030 [Thaumarchaeota archaeon 13_1_40CM_2_39_4]